MGKKIILVVEDEPDIQSFFNIIFKQKFLDYEIMIVGSYEDAQEVISNFFNRIVGACLDEHILGEGSGSVLAEEMRKKGFKGPIISISNQDLEKKKLAFFDIQFKKPLKFSELAALLHSFLGQTQE